MKEFDHIQRYLVGGVIVLQNDSILLVREKGRWGFPKGGVESDEFVVETARREAREETGLEVEITDLAFITEFRDGARSYTQVFFQAKRIGGELIPCDPDHEVEEARFVPIKNVHDYITFLPRIISLEKWLEDRSKKYFCFDLKQES